MAEPAKYGLNEDEVVILRGVVARVKNGTLNTGKTSDYKTDVEEQQAPDTYLAKSPAGGIPALIAAYDDHGTGSGSPVTASHEDQPGTAQCQVYETVITDDGTPACRAVDTLVLDVYNFALSAVPGDTYILISKDKFGTWCVSEIYWEVTEC